MKIMKASRMVAKTVAAAVLVLSAGPVLGGQVSVVPVAILDDETGAGYAWGGMLGARNSANAVEFISCNLQAQSGAHGAVGYCVAKNAAGLTRMCLISGAMSDVVQSITAYSVISFAYNDEGTCVSIAVTAASSYMPAN